ncbi:MAG: 4-hydroxy-tetrahydrodipicolinate synthase [Sphingobacteriaceae bacterium]|jgi:4-hydroxy-tetrahydrodipicolinate synthase|nr:4-hydroxy-tetrahydrodipicolinate synthase [Sphingobacteriaceae bacterium]
MNKFYGTGVAMVTPFNADGKIDYAGLKNLINFLIDGGVEYLVSLGTTGESATLTHEEKTEVWSFTAATVAGRVPLVVGIGGNNTLEITKSLEEFNSSGYDAVLSVSPYYNKPTQEGIYQHYKAVSEASPLPVILYNVPGRTASNITADTTLRLAHDFKNIIAIKEASGDFNQFNKIAKEKPEGFLLISGDDPVTLPMIALGAAGLISVVGNAFPRILSDMVRLCLDGKFREAQPLHYSLLKFTELCFVEGNPAGVKAGLKELGVCGDTLRLPLVNVGQGTLQQIKDEVRNLSN